MLDAPGELLINAFHCASPSQAWAGLWAHPRSNGTAYATLDYWTKLARTCEAGLLDGIFLADSVAIPDTYEGSPAAMLRAGCFTPALDPMLVIPPMAMVTDNLCFGVTGNLSYEPAYLLARRLSTLDHLTGGRVAWNVVTGLHPGAARAFGQDGMMGHDDRYSAADDYMAVMYGLWEGCWADDAVCRDPVRRIYADPARVRAMRHDGPYHRCQGIHLAEPSPQRTPLLFSAGSSPAGVAFAARHSECVFVATGDRQAVRRTVQALRHQAAAFGRAPGDLKVFLAMTVITAPTDAEAHDLHREYETFLDRTGILAQRSGLLGMDLSGLSPDDPLPSGRTNASQGTLDNMRSRPAGPRVRDLTAFSPARDAFLVGSPSSVCDGILGWVEDTGIDGLNLMRTVEPEWLDAFCALVVPELQNRGAFKTGYRAGSMRDKMFGGSGAHLNARHPAATHRFVAVETLGGATA